jgi:DNA-binding transcriptional ArsR family regulator
MIETLALADLTANVFLAGGGWVVRMDTDELVDRLSAVANPHRLRILAHLAGEPTPVSELARRLGMSRALLYMHIRRLEEAGYVTGHLELSADGKAMKYFELLPFALTVDIDTVVAAVSASPPTPSNVDEISVEGDQDA